MGRAPRATLIKAHISAEKANKKISITKIAPSSPGQKYAVDNASHSKKQQYILPFSDFRHNWDILVIGCSVFTWFIIPYNICFGVEVGSDELTSGHLWRALAICFTDVVFLTDIFFNFKTAYYPGGSTGGAVATDELVTDLKLIRKHYMKGAFAGDMLAAIPMGILDILKVGYPGLLEVYLLPWAFRFRRMGVVNRVMSSYQRTKAYTFLRLMRLLFTVLLSAHLVGCLWYYMISHNYENGIFMTRWDYAMPAGYPEAIYHGLLMLLGENTEPETNLERFFSLCVLVAGAAMVATIFGNLSLLIANMNASTTRFTSQMDKVHEIMTCLKLPEHLRERVNEYYVYKWARSSGFDEDDFLQELSKTLRSDVSQFLRKDIITKCPFFQKCNLNFIDSIIHVMQREIYLPEDFVIPHNRLNVEMFFISHGTVEITYPGTPAQVLESGNYFGENALLPPFDDEDVRELLTKICAKAVTHCDLYTLNKHDFDRIMASAPAKDQDRVLNQLTKAINKRTKKQNKSRKTIKVSKGTNYWAKLKSGGKLATELKKQGSVGAGITGKKGLAGLVKAAASIAKNNANAQNVSAPFTKPGGSVEAQNTAASPSKSSVISEKAHKDLLADLDVMKGEMSDIKEMLNRISQYHGLGHGTRRKTMYVREEEVIAEEFVEEEGMQVLNIEEEEEEKG